MLHGLRRSWSFEPLLLLGLGARVEGWERVGVGGGTGDTTLSGVGQDSARIRPFSFVSRYYDTIILSCTINTTIILVVVAVGTKTTSFRTSLFSDAALLAFSLPALLPCCHGLPL